MENEIWIPIKDFENLYEISNLGRIKNKKGRIRKSNYNCHGREVISLVKDKKTHTITIHRLLAIAFIPNPENKKEVNHIDGNKKNNNLNNLEWVTPKENMQHARLNGLIVTQYGEECSNVKLKESEVIRIRKLYYKYNWTVSQIYEIYKNIIIKSHLVRIIRYKSWKHTHSEAMLEKMGGEK